MALGTVKDDTLTTGWISLRPENDERVPAAIEVPAEAASRCRKAVPRASGWRAAMRSTTSRVGSTRACGPYCDSQPSSSTTVSE